MKKYFTCIAQPSVSDEPIEPVTLVIAQKQPIFTTLEAQDELFQDEAQHIESILYGALPGGLYDRLLGKMLERKATHFRVSHKS